MDSPAIRSTPYSGVTLSGLTAMGRYLGLASAFYDPMSASGGTWALSATAAVDQGMMKLTPTNTTNATVTTTTLIPASGDFDIAMRYDMTEGFMDTTSGAGVAAALFFTDGSANQVSVRIVSGGAITNCSATLNSTGGTVIGTLSPVNRYGWLRLKRVGNVFTGFVGDPLLLQWTQIAVSGTLAYGATANIKAHSSLNAGSPGANTVYMADYSSLRATGTTGTATWDVDTVRGLRGLSAPYIPGATGSTVLVEYKVATTQAGLSAVGSWTTWTEGASSVTPDPAVNRWVRVRITVTVLAIGDLTPLVTSPFVFYDVDANPMSDMARVYVSSYVRHTRANGLVAVNAAPNAGTIQDYWISITPSLAKYINAGYDATTFACDGGTTVNLVSLWATSIAQFFVDTSTATNNPVNGAQAVLRACIQCPTLYAALSGACKTNIQTKAPASSITAVNVHAMMLVYKECSNILSVTYPGDGWPTYNGASLDTNWNALEADYLGGWYDDSSGSATRYDSYSTVIKSFLDALDDIGSTYRTTTRRQRVLEVAAARYDMVDPYGGNPSLTGRSINLGVWGSIATDLQILGDNGMASADAYTRDEQTRGIIKRVGKVENVGFGISPALLDRQGNAGAVDSYTTFSSTTYTGWLGNLADLKLDPDHYNVLSASAPHLTSAYYAAHYNIGSAFFRGPGANDPKVEFWTKTFDTATSDNFVSKYAARIALTKHAQNVGVINSGPSLLNGVWWYRDSGLSANNYCTPVQPTTGLTFVVGRGVGAWRRCSLKEYSATVVGTTVPTTVLTESLLGWANGTGTHVFSGAYLALGGRTSSLFRYTSPPTPYPLGGAAANQTTGTDWAYQECPADLGSAGQFCRNISVGGTNPPSTNNAANAGSAALEVNRLRYGGRGIAAIAAAGTGDQFGAVHQVFSDAAFTPATYATYLTGYAQAGKHHSFQDGDGGISYVSGDPATDSANPVVGNWTLTGTNVMVFRGNVSAGTWGGAGDVTALSYGATSLITATVAGNLAFDTLSATRTRLWLRTTGNVTAKAAICPTNCNQVLAYDLVGNAVDVTASCSLSGGDWTIPQSVIAAYTKVGVPYFDLNYNAAAPVPSGGGSGGRRRAREMQIDKGTTSKIVRLSAQDSSGNPVTGLAFNTAGLKVYYQRENQATPVAVTLVAATPGTYTSGGFVQLDATNMPGEYELGLPNAALATGAGSVRVLLTGTGFFAAPLDIQLTDLIETRTATGLLVDPTHKLSNAADGSVLATVGTINTLALQAIHGELFTDPSHHLGVDVGGLVGANNVPSGGGSSPFSAEDAAQFRYLLGADGTREAPVSTDGLLQQVAGYAQRSVALLGENQAFTGTSFDANGNVTAGILRLYQTQAQAQADDGVTGLISSYNVSNTWVGRQLVKSITKRIS